MVGVATGKAELVGDVLCLPELAASQPGADAASPTVAELEALLRGAARDLQSASAQGHEADAAAASLLPADHDALVNKVARAIGTEAKGSTGGRTPAGHKDALGRLLYRFAMHAVADGDLPETVVALAVLATLPSGRADGLLGLAICALRLHRYDAARTLGLETLKLRPGHPRACCIVGFCELERGDRKSAQHYLAVAARLGRQQPEFREDLRAAQRLLLMMHIA